MISWARYGEPVTAMKSLSELLRVSPAAAVDPSRCAEGVINRVCRHKPTEYRLRANQAGRQLQLAIILPSVKLGREKNHSAPLGSRPATRRTVKTRRPPAAPRPAAFLSTLAPPTALTSRRLRPPAASRPPIGRPPALVIPSQHLNGTLPPNNRAY